MLVGLDSKLNFSVYLTPLDLGLLELNDEPISGALFEVVDLQPRGTVRLGINDRKASGIKPYRAGVAIERHDSGYNMFLASEVHRMILSRARIAVPYGQNNAKVTFYDLAASDENIKYAYTQLAFPRTILPLPEEMSVSDLLELTHPVS